jgi:hypothetical protein
MRIALGLPAAGISDGPGAACWDLPTPWVWEVGNRPPCASYASCRAKVTTNTALCVAFRTASTAIQK